jgi:hypothetical protein
MPIMRQCVASGRGRGVVWALLVVCGWGCARRSEGFERYIPDPAPARSALAAALDAWRAGQPPGKIETTTPTVMVVDSQRPIDQRLTAYEILGDVLDQNARCFTVRIHLDGDEEPRIVRYTIFGLDPLWVFRREDYERISHWEHAMPEDSPEEAKARPSEKPGF